MCIYIYICVYIYIYIYIHIYISILIIIYQPILATICIFMYLRAIHTIHSGSIQINCIIIIIITITQIKVCKESNLPSGNLALHLPAEGEDEAHGHGVGRHTGASSEGHQVVEVVHQRQDRVEDVVYVLKQTAP